MPHFAEASSAAVGGFVYSFVKITQKERSGEEEGRGTYLWLIILVLLFMLYGLYTWGVYPLKD